MSSSALAALIATLVAGSSATSGHAVTSTPATAPIGLTVVVMDHFGDNRLRGAVRRTVAPTRQDLIVIKRSEITPEFLVFLARALASSITRQGASPAEPINMYFLLQHTNLALTPAERTWATTLMAQLATARSQDFGRLGRHPAINTTFEAH